ncbi:MAG: Rrf2 family transcriptional regulator [Roseovarius sp.]|nr:Rrf2 family transcriptional regulator [Roseovarius sp.]
MRLTKRTNLAFRVLMFCGNHSDRLATKSEIAEQCNTSESHLAQVVNQLAQLGYLHTRRGRSGGLRLARPMREIAVGAVFRDLEAPKHQTECLADTDDTCPLSESCRLRDALADAAEAFFTHLDKLSLEDLVCGNDALAGFFAQMGCSRRLETTRAAY